MAEPQANPVEPAPSWFAEYRRSSHARGMAALICAETVAALGAGASYYGFNSAAKNHYQPFTSSIETMLPADRITKPQLQDLQQIVLKEKAGGITLDPRERVSEMVRSFDTYQQHSMKQELRVMQENINHKLEDSQDLAYFSLGLSLLALTLAVFAIHHSYQIGKEKLY